MDNQIVYVINFFLFFFLPYLNQHHQKSKKKQPRNHHIISTCMQKLCKVKDNFVASYNNN